MADEKPRMLTIWFFVSLILLAYGLFITGAGIYYLSRPPDVVLAEKNASLWWGLIMLVAGAIFFIADRTRRDEPEVEGEEVEPE